MLEQLKKLGSDSLLYALMNMGTKLIAFFMMPVYTRYLGINEYGALEMLDMLISMLVFFVIFGTDSALAFYYFDTEDKNKKIQYIKNIFLFRVSISVIFLIITIIFGEWISGLVFKSKDYYFALLLSMIVLLSDTFITLLLSVFRFEFKTMKVIVYTLLQMLLVAIFSYAILVYFFKSLQAILLARILSGIIIIFLIGKNIFPYFSIKFNKKLISEILSYAAPLVPASISFWVIAFSNRFFLTTFDSLKSVAIYGVAFKYASMITLLTSGVQLAWRPYSMSIKDKENAELLFSKIVIVVFLIGLSGILVITTIMPWVILMVDKSFFEAYKYVGLISIVVFLNFFYMIISIGLFFKKKTKYISLYFGLGALVSILLNSVLIPSFSIWGAIAAYLISHIIPILLIFQKSQTYYYLPIPYGKLLFLFLNFLFIVISIIYIQENNNLSKWYILIMWTYFFVSVLLVRLDKEFKRPPSNASAVSLVE